MLLLCSSRCCRQLRLARWDRAPSQKWKFVQGYTGVIFSQLDAFQRVTTDTYPGDDPVSLASKVII